MSGYGKLVMASGQVTLKMSDWPVIVYSGKADHFMITAEVINAFIRRVVGW